MGGVLRSMLQCPMGSVVTVPYFALCCVTCYVATIVSLEARCITVRTVAVVDLDAERGGTAAGGTSDGSAARGVCEAFLGTGGRHAPGAEVSGMGAMVYGGS